jgi:hypothetical protein
MNNPDELERLDFSLQTRDIIDQEILSEAVRPGVKGATFVDAREIINESPQHRTVVQHKGIDRDALARDPLGGRKGVGMSCPGFDG